MIDLSDRAVRFGTAQAISANGEWAVGVDRGRAALWGSTSMEDDDSPLLVVISTLWL